MISLIDIREEKEIDSGKTKIISGSIPKYGFVFNIDRYAVHDGPGIRTMVYLKGCPLRCKWCCNPEGQKPNKEVIKFNNICIGCGICIDVCEKGAISLLNGRVIFDKRKCDYCGKCVDLCPSKSMSLYGRKMSSWEILEICKKDIRYYERSGGGITLSGGEPTLQYEFSSEILSLCKDKGINTAVETCGYSPWDHFEQVIKFTDYVLFDIKQLNSDKHLEWTGVSNELILGNLKKLAKMRKLIFIRIPLIPGVNDSLNDIGKIGSFIKSLKANIAEINLLPYHKYGVNKYAYLQVDYSLKSTVPRDSTCYMDHKNKLEELGFVVKIGG